MVSGLKAGNVAASLKLRNANVQKAYCEKNYLKNPFKTVIFYAFFVMCTVFPVFPNLLS